ncbi:MAG: geranylgeranyl reductase family protein [Deltaproteobacteria bacterium]
MYDVIVVGAGPAGAALSMRLARSGIKALAIDKAKFPRKKPCGGSISLKTCNILDIDLGAVIEDVIFGTTFSFKGERSLDVMSERPIGYSVSREVFDDYLLSKAKDEGAEVSEGLKVERVIDEGDCVTAFCEGGKVFKAKFLAFADGAGAGIGKTFFDLNPREGAVSLACDIPYDRDSFGEKIKEKVFIDFGFVPYGYAWIFPKKKVLSVGVACDISKAGRGIKEYFDSFLKNHEFLKGCEVKNVSGWTIPAFYGDFVNLTKGRVLAVGDAGHLVDPFLGEGIYYAIKSGHIAADALEGAIKYGVPLNKYDERLRSELYPGFMFAAKLSSLVYRHPRLWYRMVEKEPHIILRYYDVVRGLEDIGDFYEWMFGMIKSKPWKVLRSWIESKAI